MTQLSNDCFKHSKKRISLEKAVSILEKRIKCIKKTQKIKLDQALGRILSKDIVSKLNVPPFNNTAVDGYAFKYLDLNKKKETTLKLAGRITAGKIFNKKISFFLTLGNHDHKKEPKAFLEIASKYPLIYFPNFFYQKNFGSICFVALDTTVFDKIYMFNKREAQIKWLQKTKQSLKNNCKFSIAVGHHPLFSSGDRKRATPQLSIFLNNHISN